MRRQFYKFAKWASEILSQPDAISVSLPKRGRGIRFTGALDGRPFRAIARDRCGHAVSTVRMR
jgi:hypothetical protein